jgi:hypothetical protein
MAEIINRLPIELANMIYSYVGLHPVADIVNNWLIEDAEEMEWCVECDAVHFTNGSVNEMCEGKCLLCYEKSNNANK